MIKERIRGRAVNGDFNWIANFIWGIADDVLKTYTPVDSYYKLVKTIEGDPEFDTKRAKKKLRRFVESRDHAIRVKALRH